MGIGGLYKPHWGGNPRPLEAPPNEGLTRCDGTAVPTDATYGFAPGCIFRKVNGTAGDLLYVNNGTLTSCSFKAIPTGGITGAADVGITDTGGYTLTTNVETAIQELYLQNLTIQGFIPLPLMGWRAVASNDIPALAGTPASGILASDTAPKLKRANTSTDKTLKIEWAATSVIEITQGFYLPPDADVVSDGGLVVTLRGKMGGATDTPTITIGCFDGIGSSNGGQATGALSSSLGTVTALCTITTTTFPNFVSVSLTPGTHGTDTVQIYESYVAYRKKLLAS